MKGFFALFFAQFRILLRNRLDLFLTLGFPLVFVLLFGFIFAAPEGPVRLGAVFISSREPLLQVLSEFPEISLKEFANVQDLESALARRQLDFGLVWDGESLLFLFERSRVQDNPTFHGYARRIARALELRLAGVDAPIQAEKVHVGKLPAATWFHYIVPGLMAMAILQAGVLAAAGRLAAMRELRILRRLLATPVSGWAMLLGVGLVRMLSGFLSASFTFLFASFLFRVEFLVKPGWLLFYALVSALGAMGLGAGLSILVRKPGNAAAAGMILVQAMLFLSGINIPLEFLPVGLQLLAKALPAYYMAQGIRAALGVVEGVPANFWAGLGFGAFGILSLLLFGRLLLRPD
ncbi:MAG: ABC transporter permease [Candidatus Bipolaricaulaceae bacterium]